MVLIFYAFSREMSGLRGRLAARQPLGNGLAGLRGSLGGQELALVATGIGAERARAMVRRTLAALPAPRLVISSGVAGALADHLRAGDLVIANRLLLEDDHTQTLLVEESLVAQAERTLRGAGLRCTTGAILTAGRVLASVAAKRAARDRFGAIAVDMESAAVALEARAQALPVICVRAIMDEANDEIPGADLADGQGKVAVGKAARFFLRNPGALIKIPTVMRNLSRATTALGGALEALCVQTSTPDAAPHG